ncbi:MAG: ATP-binding cassette domain-containing protein [Chloroflexi bacterium]|nr:ATP-binding cassette domain-containing protein [Chloroflexota bacterium]
MTQPALVVENLSFRYHTRPELALRDVSFQLEPGELLLVAGSSGCGKTTLARCINGLIPRSYRGELSGSVRLHGREVSAMSLVDISQVIGTLLQDPERQIVATNVTAEIAFGPENLGLPREEILTQIEQVVERLNIKHLLQRDTFTLSGGEKQKIALAGLLAMRPSILLLDEPLASLDPASAYEALDVFRRLADEGATIVLIEHRVEDALHARPDRLLYMAGGEVRYLGPVKTLPPEISHHEVKLPAPWVVQRVRELRESPKVLRPLARPMVNESPLVVFEDVSFAYGEGPTVLHDINLEIHRGDLIAVLGPNGAGKSTLAKHTIGLLKPKHGRVLIEGTDTRQMSVAHNARSVGYVFQSPTHMLFAPTVREELAFGPGNLGYPPEETWKYVDESIVAVNLAGLEEYPPLGLSFGQQKRTTIAAVLAMRSKIMIMDEPTAGQDFANYTRFMETLCGVALEGGKSLLTENFAATLFITHDLDLAVTYANRVLLIGDGRIVADGSPEEVLQDFDLLARYRVRPTSLLRLNCELYPQTRRFMPAEALAACTSV